MSRFVKLEFDHESEGRQAHLQLKDEGYYLGQAQAAFEGGRFEAALRAYSKVLEYNSDNQGAWTGQVRALIELGTYAEALRWAERALERYAHDPELLSAKAVALARSGDVQGALAFSDAAIEERGDTPFIWLARADVMLASDAQRADYCFEKALALAPRNWFVAWLAARIRYFYEQFAQALKLAQQALEWEPGRGVLWLLAGLCQRELGLLTAARTSLLQAGQLDPGGAEAPQALRELDQIGWSSKLRNIWRRFLSP